MHIHNKHKHLHYLVCLGRGLRNANADITRDALPEKIQDQLDRLASAGDAATDCGGHCRRWKAEPL